MIKYMMGSCGILVGLILSESLMAARSESPKAPLSVQVDFSAVVDGISDFGYLPDEIGVGDTLSGYYVYELGSLDLDPDSHRGMYEYAALPNRLVVNADGGWVFGTSDANPFLRFTIGDSLVWGSGGPADTYRFWSGNNVAEVIPSGESLAMGGMFVDLVDSSLTAHDSDSLPANPPEFERWQDQRLLVIAGADGGWAIFATLITSDPPSLIDPYRRSAGLWLGVNSPNPFNPQTRIPFSISRSGRVALVIYDVKGRVVRRLLDGSYPAGEHDTVWDGRDDAGRPVSSGTYFYRLSVDGRSIARKGTLVK